MSAPAEDLGILHAAREAELERQQLLDWARQRSVAMAPAATAPGQTPPSPTPELQDPSTPAPVKPGIGPADFAKDVGRGIIAAPREIAGGAVDAIRNSAAAVKDVADWLPAVNDLPGLIYEPGKGVRIAKGSEVRAAPGMLEAAANAATPDIAPSGTNTGALIRGVAQFAAPFAAVGKMQAIQSLAKALPFAAPLAQGALANFAAFDPDQKRLSNLVQEFPALQNPVTEYLATNPQDSEAEGRFKMALEGLGLGLATDGLMKGVKALRNVALAKQAAGVTDEAATTALVQAEGQQAEATAKLGDPAKPALSLVQPAEADRPGQVFVNWSRINSHDDVKAMVQELADARGGNIDTARRGVRSWETTKLDAATKDAWETLQSRKIGQPLNAEETFAVRELWVRSGARVRELAQSVANNGGELDQLAFRKQLLVHNAIQEQVIAARTETARALNAWAIPAGDTPAFAGQMDQLRQLAMSDRTDLKQIARGVVSLNEAGLGREAEAFMESSTLAKGGDALRQAWYGALLSNPKTLVRNLTGNTSNLLLQIPETKVANWIGKAVGQEAVPDGEAMQRLFGMVQGYKDAWTISAKSRQVFETALDKMAQEGDEAGARALFAADADAFYGSLASEAQGGVRPYEVSQAGGAFDPQTWGIDRNSMRGRPLAFLETATTASSNALQRTDEMFKSMAYNMELRAQAYRQATQELASNAITKGEFPDRLAEIMASPTDAMRLASRANAEVQTFTNRPLDTPLWQWIQKWHNVPVFGEITMPFARTPYNIATQTLQRTPLSPFMKSWREDILAGGSRGHMAWSKFIVGNTILLSAADLAMNGYMTGAGPSDPSERATLKREGWQPWSVKVGSAYYDVRGIDPIGPLLGLASNTVDILKSKDFGQADADGKLEQLVISTSMSIAAQVTDQSFMTGASAFFDAMSDPQRYGEKWWQQLTTSAVIPRGVAAIERVTDPTQRIAWDIGTSIRSQTPGLSKDLPPARDVWGRPLTSGAGFSPWYNLLSPFSGSEIKPNPVDTELNRLEKWIATPERKISFRGGSAQMTPQQYSRYVELAGNAHKIDGQGLYDRLESIISGKDDLSDVYRDPATTDGPDGGKSLMIDRFVRMYRESAKMQLTEEFPDLAAKLDQSAEEKRQALSPQ